MCESGQNNPLLVRVKAMVCGIRKCVCVCVCVLGYIKKWLFMYSSKSSKCVCGWWVRERGSGGEGGKEEVVSLVKSGSVCTSTKGNSFGKVGEGVRG